MLNRWLPFIGLVAVLVAIPGPAVILAIRTALTRGTGTALRVSLGAFIGDLVWVAAAVFGVTTLLVSSQIAFDILRWAGAAYLVYLGVRLIRTRRGANLTMVVGEGERDSAGAGGVEGTDGAEPTPERRRLLRHPLVEGMVIELSNPKTLLVFTSVIPQFLPNDADSVDVAMLGVTFALLGLTSMSLYSVLMGATRKAVAKSGATHRLLRLSGGILVTFGIRLVLEQA